MKNKKIILISCFILIILSLNAISATSTDDADFSTNLQETTSNDINSNILTQKQMVYVDSNSQSQNEDGSLESPYKSINNDNLDKISSNSTIHVSKGTYELNHIDINKDLSIIGEDKEEVVFIPTINTNVITIGSGIKVNFANFTFKDCKATSDSAIINNGNLKMENINFLNNGVSSRNSINGNILNNANLEVINSTFSDNTASFGAAIYNKANTTVKSSEFSSNYIYNVGGAIYSLRGNLTVYDSLFTLNTAVSGAAIYNAAGYLYANNTKFIENDAEHFYGGAIYSTGITITENSIFDSNHANMDGGAITNTNNFTIINCSFIENSANENGGVIENVPWTITENGNLTIIDSSFIENSAGKKGGVIMNYGKVESEGETATVTVRNSFFDSNSATYGGVIYNEQYLDFQYCVFWYNDAEDGCVVFSDEDMIKSIDNNWWGVNDPDVDEIGATPNNWIILTFTNTTQFVTNLTANLRVALNTLNTGETIDVILPSRTAIFSAQKTQFYGYESLQIPVESSTDISVESLGDEITVTVDSQSLSLEPVNRTFIKLTVDDIDDSVYGNNVTITGKFMDIEGKAISNSNLHVFVNNKKYITRTDNHGVYLLEAKVTGAGTNNVSVGYNGNDKYAAGEVNTTFNAEKQDVIVSVDSIADSIYADNVTITGKFTDVNGKAIINSNVRVFVNGKKYLSRTDSEGIYVLNAKVTNVGVNNVSVGYGGNDKYNSYEYNTTFNAVSQDVIVSVDSIADTKVGENVTITGKFTDKNGKAISNSNVKILINGKKYFARTDSNGDYAFTTIVTNAGINNVTVAYGGSDKYNSYEDTTNFNAGSQDVIITYEPIGEVRLGDNITITGKFTDKYNKAITNSNVKITVNGNKNYARTDSTGTYTFTTNVDNENMNVVLSYAGSVKYNKYSTKVTVAVKK